MKIPDLPNGLPRVAYDPDSGLSILVTEDMPVFLIVGDEQHKLVFETTSGAEHPMTAIVRAVPKESEAKKIDE